MAAALQRTIDVAWVEAIKCDRRPHAERLAQRERAVQISLDQPCGALARERLDAQRTRQAHKRPVEPVRTYELCPASRVFVLTLDHIGPLASQKQNGESLLVAHERKLVSLGKRLHERVGPKMLVDVGLHGIISRFSISFMKISI